MVDTGNKLYKNPSIYGTVKADTANFAPTDWQSNCYILPYKKGGIQTGIKHMDVGHVKLQHNSLNTDNKSVYKISTDTNNKHVQASYYFAVLYQLDNPLLHIQKLVYLSWEL